MAVDLLDAPLRVTWDLYSETGPSLSSQQLSKVAEHITEAGVFFVSLEAQPLRHSGIAELITTLSGGGSQVALTTDGSPEDVRALGLLPGPFSLFLDAATAVEITSVNQQELGHRLARLRQLGLEPALLWTPRHRQLPRLLDLIRFCLEQQIGRFKLPNQKIGANPVRDFTADLPDSSDIQQLSAAMQATPIGDLDALQLEVHDLFLWELLEPFCPGERSEYGGCQAGNSLGHIDAAGQLFPCSSWPEALGNLLQTSFLDLWQSRQRLAIREEISGIPSGCEGCSDYQICFGGCRGLSRFCRNDELGRDLLCTDRR